MIALDTNVLVRFLVEDDPEQSARAGALIERAVKRGQSLYVSDIALCETVWVLTSCYELSRVDVATALRDLLRARHLAFTAPDRLGRALDAYERAAGDFADYLIREHARDAGYQEVATFDRTLLKEAGFVAP